MTENREKLAADLRLKFQGYENVVKIAQAREKSALEKMAGVQMENRILRETLDLVSNGVIDPADAIDKVEEFSQDPEQLEVVKQAYKLGFDTVPSVGAPSEDVAPDPERDPAGELNQVLRDLEPSLRKNTI
jgi:hypothetical protein